MYDKKIIFLIVIIASVGLTPAKGGNADSIFAKFGTILPDDHPTSKSLDGFQEEVRKILHDQLTIQIFPDAQLGSTQRILEGLQFGNIEMGTLSTKLLSSRLPLLTAIFMPYIFRDDGHRFRVFDGPIGKQLLHQLEEVNLVGLGFLDTGMQHFISREAPLLTPDDFKGHNIGLIHPCIECQNITRQLAAKTLEAMGAETQRLPLENIDSILRTDTLHGIEYTPLAGFESRLDNTGMMYFTLDAHSTIPDMIVASKRWFETLPPQVQQALRKAATATVRQQRKLWADAIQQVRTEFQAQNITFTAVDKQPFWDAVQPLYHQMYKDLGTDFKDIIKAIRTVR